MAADPGPRRHNSLEISQSLEDDHLLDAPLLPAHTLMADIRPKFHPVPTIHLAVLLMCVHVVFVILAFVAGILCSAYEEEDAVCQQYIHPLRLQTVIVIAKMILWLLHVLFEQYIQYHHSKVRSRGYLVLYRSTKHLKRLPLIVHSTGSASLLLILSIEHSFPDFWDLYLYLMLGVLGLELSFSLVYLGVYTVKISKFNREKQRPDVIEEENKIAYPSHINSEIGFRIGTSLEEVAEKQGDMIEYLKRHNELLSKRLLALTSQQNRD
ncbi:transmembrane protein 192 isoform X2 [Rhinatrema bivittatum]|uniref:transmembrane protein 192 isoform X2 n=1 Tax=Rhinatrema bivittatum TaxID=194408 RepID=UPI00112C9B3D|nr:transmembrane protein 192 isoform X2 [Rhinatrema bivittatum]